MHTVIELFFQMVQNVRFFILNVLPIAGGQIYYWVRDWQILLIGVVALFLAWRWSLSVERRAERTAKEILSRMMRLRSGSSLEETDPVGDTSTRVGPLAEAASPLLPNNGALEALSNIDILMRDLKSFRKGVRDILAVTPVSDDPLPANMEVVCRKLTGVSFLRFETVPGLGGDGAKLLMKLDEGVCSMRAADSETCREVWQRLVELNATARALEESLLGSGSSASVQIYD
jgi:hypothetical protein